MKKIAVVLLGAIASLLTITSHAALDFSDTFNYTDGSIVNNSSGIWLANSGTAGSCLVTNQVLLINTARTEDIVHRLSSVYPTNGAVAALYTSFTFRCTNGLPTAAGTYFAHLTGTNFFGLSGFRARVFASITNNAGGATDTSGKFYLYIVNSVGGTTNGGNQTVALTTNATYTVVTKYVINTGISTLWINPAVEGDPSVTDSVPLPLDYNWTNGIATNGPIDISNVSFRQATGEGSLQIDNLKVGTAFSDVAGANTSPTISTIPAQNTPANTPTAALAFTIGDDGGVAGLTLTKGSSNPTLVPTNNIVFGGSGANRTVTVTPAAGLQGSSTISIFVSDGVNISSISFLLKVGAPSIASVANQITYSNTPTGSIAITLSDAEGDTLTLTKGSSNPTLLPTNNIVISGSGNNRTAILTPDVDQTGVSTISLSVADGFNTNSISFVLTVSPKLGLLLAEPFNYDAFTLDLGLYGANFGSTNSPWGHSSGTNYDLWVTNGGAMLSSTRSEDLGALIAATPFAANSGVLLYASFTTTFSNVPASGGDYFAHFKDTINGTTFRGKIFAGTNNAAAGKFRIGIANVANSASVQFPHDLIIGQTYTVVNRYNSGTGENTLWINPTSESSTNVLATDATSASSIQAFGLRQSDGIGTSIMDNLLIGTAFSDVVMFTAPIPLNISYAAGVSTLTWSDASFSLQTAPAVTGPYTTISGAVSGFSTNNSVSQIFFRLYHP